MKQFIPYEKLSKKKKRELDNKKRKTWKQISPITRVSANLKTYNRKKSRKCIDFDTFGIFINN